MCFSCRCEIYNNGRSAFIEFGEELLCMRRNSKLVKIVMKEECFLDARLDLEQMNVSAKQYKIAFCYILRYI